MSAGRAKATGDWPGPRPRAASARAASCELLRCTKTPAASSPAPAPPRHPVTTTTRPPQHLPLLPTSLLSHSLHLISSQPHLLPSSPLFRHRVPPPLFHRANAPPPHLTLRTPTRYSPARQTRQVILALSRPQASLCSFVDPRSTALASASRSASPPSFCTSSTTRLFAAACPRYSHSQHAHSGQAFIIASA
jgi:hypothetical protein